MIFKFQDKYPRAKVNLFQLCHAGGESIISTARAKKFVYVTMILKTVGAHVWGATDLEACKVEFVVFWSDVVWEPY